MWFALNENVCSLLLLITIFFQLLVTFSMLNLYTFECVIIWVIALIIYI